MEDQINGHDTNAEALVRQQASAEAGRAAQLLVATFIGNLRLNAFRCTMDLPQGHEHNALCAMAFVLGELTQLIFAENREALAATLNNEFQRGMGAVAMLSEQGHTEQLEKYQKALEVVRAQEAQAAHARILRPGDPGYGLPPGRKKSRH